jgi:hypothetical protein
MLAFDSALATTEAISGLQFITSNDSGSLLVSTGLTMQVLQWLISVLSLLFAFGISLMLQRHGAGGRNTALPAVHSVAGPIQRVRPPAGVRIGPPPPPPPPPGQRHPGYA